MKSHNRRLGGDKPKDSNIGHLIDNFHTAVSHIKQHVSHKYHSSLTPQQAPQTAKTSRTIWRDYFPVTLVAAIGILITIAAFIQSLNWEKDRVEIAFQETSQNRILVIQREIESSVGIVQDIASFFEATEIVGRREFRKFVGPALKNHAGIKALQWVPVVLADNLPAFIEQAQKSFPPFKIMDAELSGKLIESPEHPRYYPVLYIQPYQNNKHALGLNMGADPIISTLLQTAELSRTHQVSPGISIRNETREQTGIVVVVPVFFKKPEAEDAPAQPSFKIRGFAIGVFYISDIIERALESLRPGGIDLQFYHEHSSGEQELLYSHLSRLRQGRVPNAEDEADSLRKIYSQYISVGNQRWKVVCHPVIEKFNIETRNSWIILSGGLAFTFLLTIYVLTLVGRAKRVRQEVKVRTSQLQEAVLALNREVVERKSAEQELQILNETLEQQIASRTADAERKAQYLEQFAYVTSHDLKSPLRAVSNLAQWIEEDLKDKLDNSSREQLALLRDRVRRMHDLIEGLLEYSRVGKTNDSENNVDTKELIDEIIDTLSPPAGFTIKVKDKMPSLYVDRLQLGQVFSNLISNSLKHHGGNKGKIRIKSESYADVYQFSVCDDGQGIAPEYHDKVFMMFQILNSSDFESSTGIGLALVKKIIEEHGGTIRLESAVGEGACFHFTWPKKFSSLTKKD
jgi:signal transduction histidine kinase